MFNTPPLKMNYKQIARQYGIPVEHVTKELDNLIAHGFNDKERCVKLTCHDKALAAELNETHAAIIISK